MAGWKSSRHVIDQGYLIEAERLRSDHWAGGASFRDLWGLTEEQRLLVLGYPSRSTYHNWCKQAREHGAFTLDVDVLARISAVLGIHQALGVLFPTERLGVEWLRTAHNAVVFGGRPPLDLVTSGSQDGLLTVRRFLDGARGGLYMQPNTIDEAFTPYDDTEIVFR